jgi:hypothetical protein
MPTKPRPTKLEEEVHTMCFTGVVTHLGTTNCFTVAIFLGAV